MIGFFTRTLDNLTGRGEAAVTVPPLDGALRANRALDEAETRLDLPDVDDLAIVGGALCAAVGSKVVRLEDGTWHPFLEFDAPVACMVSTSDGGLAVAVGAVIRFNGGAHDGRVVKLPADIRCVTALAISGDAVLVANGSAINAPGDWRRDLLERNATGSVWLIDLATDTPTQVAGGLSWPAGLAIDGDGVVIAEAWRHRLIRVASAGAAPTTIHADLPGYPGRISKTQDGALLSVFAPRSQLIEFVLREPAYRKKMIAETPEACWIAPCLRAGRSFYEPLQGGSVKQLGQLKPWAPTMSAGLCVQLDGGFQPIASYHSRADGVTHGVTAAVEHDGQIWVAAKGDGVVVALNATMNTSMNTGGAA